jgi:hypothetical protein
MGRRDQGMGLSTHRGPVTCIPASVGFVVGVRVVFGVIVGPVFGNIAGSHMFQHMCGTRFKSARISLGTLQSFATIYSTAPSNGTVFKPHDCTMCNNTYVGEY